MPYQTYQIFLNIYNESKKRKEMEEKTNVIRKNTDMIRENTDMIRENTNDNTWSIYNIFSK